MVKNIYIYLYRALKIGPLSLVSIFELGYFNYISFFTKIYINFISLGANYLDRLYFAILCILSYFDISRYVQLPLDIRISIHGTKIRCNLL